MSLKYQHNLRRYLRYFLGLTEKLETYDEYKQVYSIQFEKEIEKAVSITNLFKCSTECEQEKIKGSSFDVCYDKFFVRELDLIQPQIILALGDEVTKYLKRKKLRLPLFSIKHPSYFYKKADESDILCSIKKSGSPGRFKVIHFF